jgi:hypothetical protein
MTLESWYVSIDQAQLRGERTVRVPPLSYAMINILHFHMPRASWGNEG